ALSPDGSDIPARGRGARPPRASVSAGIRTRGFRLAGSPDRFPVAAVAAARRAVEAHGAGGPPAPVRPGIAGQLVSAVARCAPATSALLQRRDLPRVRAGPLPADGRPD